MKRCVASGPIRSGLSSFRKFTNDIIKSGCISTKTNLIRKLILSENVIQSHIFWTFYNFLYHFDNLFISWFGLIYKLGRISESFTTMCKMLSVNVNVNSWAEQWKITRAAADPSPTGSRVRRRSQKQLRAQINNQPGRHFTPPTVCPHMHTPSPSCPLTASGAVALSRWW